MGGTGRLVCFPGFYDISSCKVFKRLTGKSVILSKATSDMFSKVIFHLKMQISVAVEWVLFEMAGGAYLNFRFLNTPANWVIECIRNCATDRQWDLYSWFLSVSVKFLFSWKILFPITLLQQWLRFDCFCEQLHATFISLTLEVL